MTMTRPFLALVLAAMAASCGATATSRPAPGASTATMAARQQALAQLLDEEWQYHLRTHPEQASLLGDSRYNDRWTDSSLAAIDADLAKTRDFLARFEAIDTTGLPADDALSQELMVRNLRLEIEGARFQTWLMPVSQIGGPHISMPQLVSKLRFAQVKDYEDYLRRLRAIPTVLAQSEALMRAGVPKHLVPPRIVLERAVKQAERLAAQAPADSPFATPVAKFPDGIPAAEQARLRTAVLGAIADQVLPAYARFTAYLRDDYVPQGRSEVGEWALPDGDARYAYDVKRLTTTAMTPDEIHALGLREVARIEAAEADVAHRLGFKDVASLQASVPGDRKLHATSRQDLLDRYQRYTDAMYAALPRLFGRLPRQKMLIQPMEAFREKESPGAQYQRGAPDGSRPGMVQVNTGDAEQRLWLDAESTAYHEGVPGHHLQVALAQELADVPPFRKYGFIPAFGEGWALYAERLGEEVGFYQDPYSAYGHLQDEMLRAIRLVVDTGLHHKRWTRDQVVAFFHAHSSIDEPTVQNETDRYISWPAQALAYKIGQLAILRLRAQAEAQLGPAFDLRAFHDLVLGGGALPLDVLERRVEAWTAAARLNAR
jgi:uncharacterized protein (DUF885 family)